MVKVVEDRDLFKDHAKVIFDTREDSTERTKWLSMRSSSIGGSEIAKIAGYSKYGTALTVYNDKLGLSEKFKGNIHTKFGNRMEPLIREWVQEDFKQATGIEIETAEYPFMMLSKVNKRFSANIDGLAILDEYYKYYENLDTGEIKQIPAGELIGIEIKTAGEFLKKMWAGEEIPDEYYCQCQWYMGVTGLRYFLIVYLLGKEVKWKVVPRNDADIEVLFKIGADFWTNNIEALVAPDPVGLECETKEILHNQSLKDKLEVNISDNLLSKYKAVDDKCKELEQEKERLKQLIYLDLGNSVEGSDGLYKVKRWEVKRDKLDIKLLKDKRPETYKTILQGQTAYVNMRITKLK
jgi:putative phage-type endonuclease